MTAADALSAGRGTQDIPARPEASGGGAVAA